MVKQSLITGLMAGLLLSLGLIYPTFALIVWPGHPEWFGVGGPNPAQSSGLMASTVISTLAMLLIGILPALRINATRWRDGAKAGVLSGTVAGAVVFVIIVSPVVAWRAVVPLFDTPSYMVLPADSEVAAFVQQVVVDSFVRWLPMCLVAGALVGWLEGGLMGFLRRNAEPAESPALIDIIDQRDARRRWFARNDDSARGALLAGLLCGGLLALASFGGLYGDLSAASPRVSAIVRDALANVPGSRQTFSTGLAAALSPLSVIAVLGFGALAILFVKNPTRRFGSRFAASMMAGGIVGGVLFIGIMRSINVTIGLARFPGYGLLTVNDVRAQLLFESPVATAAMLFLLPLVVGGVLVVMMSMMGALQGLVYAWLLPLIFQRPIDRARPIDRRLRREPEQVLPQIYNIYNRCWDATDILPHLALSLRRRQPDVARVIAAYHLSSTQADRVGEALTVMSDTLGAHDNWRWRKEVGSLYRIFDSGLRARTLEQVADIEPMPAVQTSTLPPMLSRAGDAITKVLAELKKVERVDDLNSKTIFLNNALEAIRAGQRIADAMRNCWLPPGEVDRQAIARLWRNDPNIQVVAERFKALKGPQDFMPALQTLGRVDWRNKLRLTIEMGQQLEKPERRHIPRHISTSATYPEEPALRQMLDHWQTLVMDAVKDLQGRAALISELKTKRVTYAARLPLTLTVRNDGLNVAESVRVVVNDAEGYRVIEGGQQRLELLTRGSARDVTVTIEPLTHDRLRLVWQLVYDDAVDEQRQVEFADAIEFIETESPAASFVRIFPIPYVTGMPLKTNNLFVGREDVFAYIREHLFGTYQNNVIVLHGQRRTGKTSILYRLKDVLAETHICVLVDMQGKAARGTLDFLYSLADDIVYTLEDQGCTANLPPRSDFAESPEFVFRSRFLRGVYDVLPLDSNGKQKHLLLMFDEFEELQKRVEDGKLEAEIFPFLRNLMQHEDPLDFVFAGTHKLEELGAEYWSILFNIASYKKITFLTPDDARRLITEPVAPNLEYDPLAIDRIYSVTGGHPYFVQVVCHELVSYHNETQRVYMTANDVEEVLDRIVERGEAHFKFIWSESTPTEHSVLLALADILENAETSTVDQVQDLLDKRAIDLNGTALPKVLDNLEMGDILTRSSPRSSLYRFKIDLIRRWIYATRPV